jgi:hypothetical protein
VAEGHPEVSDEMIAKALAEGRPYYDPRNRSVSYVLKGAVEYGRGPKDVLVALRRHDPTVVHTAFLGRNLVHPRFLPLEAIYVGGL